MSDLKIRKIDQADHNQWRTLWQGYLEFYEQDLTDEVTDTLWQRLMDDTHYMNAFVAQLDDKVIGFTHYFHHASTWNITSYSYLEDLYVDGNARSCGAGRALIMAVKNEALQTGSTKLYWFTNKDNKTAQALYNQVAEVAPFLRYDMDLTKEG